MLSFMILSGGAFAGELKDGQQIATAEKFFDWKFAQRVWFELNTVEKFDVEWAKYAADFNPWLALYKKDPRKAFEALDQTPKDKRKSIQRGYDMQLAIDQWWDHVYSPWYNRYPHDAAWAPRYNKKAPTFDDYLASYGQRASCFPETMLDECGPVPDWRNPAVKARAEAMMRKADQAAAEGEAKRQEWFRKR